MRKHFFGGVHPRYNKEMSVKDGEPAAVVPKQVVIPLLQHIGAPCEPLVAVGDSVLMGQKIGDGQGMCVPVHASVSGTVTAIEPRLHPNGQRVNSIVIENDFEDTSVAYVGYDAPTDKLDVDTMLHAIREAGIVGMGGAAFPSNLKALSAMGNVDTIIANACECEPYITSDDTLLRTNPTAVLEGMLLLKRVFEPEHLVIAVEDNKKRAIESLKELLENYPDIELAILPTMYPQGSEKQLIQAVTGREVVPGGLPISVECVVFNVSTFAAIYNAVRGGVPLISRIVTVSGEGVKNPQNFKVRIGTSFEELIEAAGGLTENATRVINGGPMMGAAQSELCVPAIKATNSVLCLEEREHTQLAPCIRCGKCVAACPMHLQPLYLSRFAKAGKAGELKRLNVVDCMECGCCAYSCPSKISLVEHIRLGKKLVKEENK